MTLQFSKFRAKIAFMPRLAFTCGDHYVWRHAEGRTSSRNPLRVTLGKPNREQANADLMEAYRAGDADAFCYNMTSEVFPWRRAFKAFAKLTAVPENMQKAFQTAWFETKGAYLTADSPALLTKALRAMMSSYTARRAVRLFRGAGCAEFEPGSE